MGRMISDNNILQEIISTMGLQSYLVMLHKQLIIELYEDYVRRKISKGKLFWLWIYVEQAYGDQLLMNRRNFSHVVEVRR